MESCHIIVRLIQTPEGKNKEQRNAGLGERNVELKILNTDAMMSFGNWSNNSQPLELGNLELVAKQLLRMSLAFSSHKLMFWTIWCHGQGQLVYMVTSRVWVQTLDFLIKYFEII